MCIELAPGMGSPMEHRELMRASFRFGESRTVQEVSEAISARHRQRSSSAPASKSGKSRRPAPTLGEIKKSDVDALHALMQRGRDLQAANG